jgi:hypothetical protein
MHIFFTPSVIFIGTVAGFMFGALWYGLLFSKAYMFGQGVTKDTAPKRPKKYILQLNVYSLLAHGGIATTFAALFDILQIQDMKTALYMTLFVTFGLIVTVKFLDLIYTAHGTHYEKRPQVQFLVGSGYYICMTLVMTVAVWML